MKLLKVLTKKEWMTLGVSLIFGLVTGGADIMAQRERNKLLDIPPEEETNNENK